MLGNQPEDEFAFSPGVAGVDQGVDILALDQAGEQFETVGALVDRAQVEMRWNDGKVGERPFSALDLELLRRGDLDQMADRGRQHELITFVEVTLFGETAEGLCNVRGDRGLLGDDQGLTHGLAAL